MGRVEFVYFDILCYEPPRPDQFVFLQYKSQITGVSLRACLVYCNFTPTHRRCTYRCKAANNILIEPGEIKREIACRTDFK